MKFTIYAAILLTAAASRAADSRTEMTTPEGRPNIVIILNDDQGYQDLGCFGSPNIQTPNVDRLAAEGARFTSFYSASPICSASRAGLMTGRYPFDVGVPGVFWPNRNHGLAPEQVTIAETLKSAGYATAAVGKWHLGDEPRFLPTNQGFDSYYGIPYSNDMYPAKSMTYADDCVWREEQSPETLAAAFAKIEKGQPRSMKSKVPIMRDEQCVEFPADQTTITRRYGDESIRFISESVAAEKPFFLYLANSMPHIPLAASPEFAGKSAAGLYGDTIEEIDHNTGRIMNCLEQLGVAENTIVIFTSDNGPWLTMGEAGGHALPLFEGKFTNFEGGQRVPFVIRWPGHVPAGTTCDEMALMIDLHPTLARLAGADPRGLAFDGKDIADLWSAKTGAKTPHDFYFFAGSNGRYNAVRHGDWKYHDKEIFKVKKTRRAYKGPSLYNLKDDIGEANNVIADHPEIVERLAAALAKQNAALKK